MKGVSHETRDVYDEKGRSARDRREKYSPVVPLTSLRAFIMASDSLALRTSIFALAPLALAALRQSPPRATCRHVHPAKPTTCLI